MTTSATTYLRITQAVEALVREHAENGEPSAASVRFVMMRALLERDCAELGPIAALERLMDLAEEAIHTPLGQAELEARMGAASSGGDAI